MPFQPGVSGNPKGRKPNKPNFPPLLMIALKRPAAEAAKIKPGRFPKGDDRTAMQAIADALVADALNGDKAAIREVFDRIDGRPAQAVTLAGDADSPLEHRHEGPATDAFRRRLDEISDRLKIEQQAMADRLRDATAKGDQAAIREIADQIAGAQPAPPVTRVNGAGQANGKAD